MFGIKTKIINQVTNKYFNKNKIPNNKIKNWEKIIVLKKIKDDLKRETKKKDLQKPATNFSDKNTRLIWKELNKFNPNNIGNWTENTPYHISGKLEKKLIEQFIKLYQAKIKEIGGYLTTGGTEANLYASWLGREFLENKLKTKKIIAFKTSLSHYSIEKSYKVTNLKYKNIPINEKSWGIDVDSLKKEIKTQIKKGNKGFLIPLTIGYTTTGSNDPIDDICKELSKIKKKNKAIDFFVWIDAAFAGFNYALIDSEFKPFKNKLIKLILTDLHKFPGIPYPSGMVLYRKSLLRNIENNIAYINQKDTTFSGSRSGIAAIAAWYAIQANGKKELQRIIKDSLNDKDNFIREIKKKSKTIKIITAKNNSQLCLIPQNKNDEIILKRMEFKPIKEKVEFTKQNKTVNLYKIFFLPNLS